MSSASRPWRRAALRPPGRRARRVSAAVFGLNGGTQLQLRFDPERPIYQQIIDEFKRAVARGDLKPGDRIPSQRELATQARVNPNTVQRAYREMEWMGLVETLRGQGTFVAGEPALLATLRAEMADEAVERYVGEMRALGFSSQEILERTKRSLAQVKEGGDGNDG